MTYVIYCKTINQYWYVDPRTNKPALVSDINRARIFESHHIAKNVLTCIPKGWQTHKFEILEHAVAIPKIPKMVRTPLGKEPSGSLDQKHEFLDAIQKQIRAYSIEQKQLMLELEELQMIQEDILHKIENAELDTPEEAMLLFKFAKNMRSKRRQAKNNLYVINDFFKLNVPDLGKQDVLESVTKMEALTDHSVYNPRLLTELFSDDWVDFIKKQLKEQEEASSPDTEQSEE